LKTGLVEAYDNCRRFLGDFEFFYRLIAKLKRARTYLRSSANEAVASGSYSTERSEARPREGEARAG
jgi:hypothetical protein